MPAARGSMVWLGMVLAGLLLGAYVVAAWPDSPTSAAPPPKPVRTTASLAGPESELAGSVAGVIYPDYAMLEPGTAPALDALIGGPPPVAAG